MYIEYRYNAFADMFIKLNVSKCIIRMINSSKDVLISLSLYNGRGVQAWDKWVIKCVLYLLM